MRQADGEDCQTSRGSLFESRPDIEAIDKLLREQESIEERKREENSKKCILDQEATLLSELLHQALKRVQELDSEIGTTMSQIFERQKYNTAVETLFDEEADKGRKMSETLRSMEIHEAEQVRLIDAITDHLDSRGISIT
ncbi:hypothetical protein PSENEW3n2_00000763 [Picochlorum sp. SENEW3]|nr:hypothetical protein PSENEW3n2_00000763 [Picochlorum sp. SENEW3]WPT15684.1 hypothetical protein PSENEW3_00000763 [Picochlorum sp. SENEW3]